MSRIGKSRRRDLQQYNSGRAFVLTGIRNERDLMTANCGGWAHKNGRAGLIAQYSAVMRHSWAKYKRFKGTDAKNGNVFFRYVLEMTPFSENRLPVKTGFAG